jgi:flagellar biosynthesis anti-sigma factor FlgM
MKIENVDNNGISPLTPKKAESAYRADRKQASSNAVSGGEQRDKAEVSENARVLASARAAMDKTSQVENEQRLAEIRKQISNGDYKIQVEAIARRLMTGVFSKS